MAVPVVSTPLNTRTETQWLSLWGWEEWRGSDVELATLHPSEHRERLVADPAYVVLPEVPDLTCRTCEGRGTMLDTLMPGVCVDIDGQWWHDPFDPKCGRCKKGGTCPSCGGSGVSPVYDATRLCVIDGDVLPWCGVECNKLLPPNEAGCERRQLVEWRARRVEPLPVYGFDWEGFGASEPHDCLVLVENVEGLHLVALITAGAMGEDRNVTNEPWAKNLQPGMCVLRLSDWEHLEQPYTEMPGEPSTHGASVAGLAQLPPSALQACIDHDLANHRVPLSVPDGVLSWIELAR